MSLPADHPGDGASSASYRSRSRRHRCTKPGRRLQIVVLHLAHGNLGFSASASAADWQVAGSTSGPTPAPVGSAALSAPHHPGRSGGAGEAEQHAVVPYTAIPALTPRVRPLQLQVSVRRAMRCCVSGPSYRWCSHPRDDNNRIIHLTSPQQECHSCIVRYS